MSSQTLVFNATTGTSNWNNPASAYTINNTYAVTTAAIANNANTGALILTNGGGTIPSGATIDGVECTVEAKNQLSGNGFQVAAAFLRSGGVSIGSSKTTTAWNGVADSSKTMGSPTDLWSATLTPTICNASDFGIRIIFKNTNGTSQTFSVDCVTVIVHYTTAGGVVSSQQFFMQSI
jgi:hypothetical protein